MSTTAAQIAKAAGVAPRTKRFILRDELGLPYGGSQTENFLAALGRSDRVADLDQATRIAARATFKALATGRMNVELASVMRRQSPYRLCKVVAYIVSQVGEEELLTYSVGPIADDWINAHRAEIAALF